MSEQFHRRIRAFARRSRSRDGKVTIFTTIVGCLVLVGFMGFFNWGAQTASADDVTTSVTVLNTPPQWDSPTGDAQESTESSTTIPTNSGSVLSFVATATDSSNDNYYLIICKASSTPTANAGTRPSCGGGISDQWAVSAAASSTVQATASTSTIDTFPFNAESNDWYAYICDDNATLPRCNPQMRQGSGNTASPFIINHAPVFASVTNDTPANPGETVTWTTVAYDNDALGGADTVQLIICRTAGFSNGNCTGGLAYATSTLQASNPSTSTPIVVPTQDRWYNAYAYLIDQHGRVATSTVHGSISGFEVSNVAPSVSAALISLVDTDNVGDLTLTVPGGRTTNFKVQFTTSDNNSCLTASSTDEITSAIANIYRSGVTQASCQVSGDFDANSCYPAASPYFGDLSCTQDGASCSGATDTTVTYTCTFGLWYIADPTDGSTPWTAQNWLASVQTTDNNATSSSLTESTSGNELTSFLAFDVSTTSVAFGALEPGQSNDPLVQTTDLQAIGNVGLDEDLYGDTMCTNWTAPDSCDAGGINPASEIPVGNQKVATSSIAYAHTDTFTLTSSSTPLEVLVNVPKTTATGSIQTRNTYWGISIPGTITLAGSYTGEDTITAKVSAFANW